MKNTKSDAAAVLIASFVIIPLIAVLCWNYGMTEIIQNLGGPDANVNLLDGFLTVYFLAFMGGLGRGGISGYNK